MATRRPIKFRVQITAKDACQVNRYRWNDLLLNGLVELLPDSERVGRVRAGCKAWLENGVLCVFDPERQVGVGIPSSWYGIERAVIYDVENAVWATEAERRAWIQEAYGGMRVERPEIVVSRQMEGAR